MKRRSFFRKLFGAVVGGLAAPQLVKSIAVVDPAAPFYPRDPAYHFGFTGFKPAPAHRGVADEYFGWSPLEGRVYHRGDTFEIIGPGGRGTVPLHKVGSVDTTE